MTRAQKKAALMALSMAVLKAFKPSKPLLGPLPPFWGKP